MPVLYEVQFIAAVGDERVAEFQTCVADQLRANGLHRAIEIALVDKATGRAPCAAVFLGSPEALADSGCTARVGEAFRAGRAVLPVISTPEALHTEIPDSLRGINAYLWAPGGAPGLARFVLEELGIEERQRRVFISHRRQDGLLMAEQVHDALRHQHFTPFIDRFAIAPGSDVQREIADALEDYAYLLLLESPLAAESDWVFYEFEYALAHYMGLSIVSWPGASELPGTHGIPRHSLQPSDLTDEGKYKVLTPDAVERVVAEVETHHARGLVRRRQYLLVSVEDALTSAGKAWSPLPHSRLFVQDSNELVGVAPRLPTVEDLHELDSAAGSLPTGHPSCVLVHASRNLTQQRRSLLTWATANRAITLVPENGVGRYW